MLKWLNDVFKASEYMPMEIVIWTIIVIVGLFLLALKVFPTLRNWFEVFRLKKNTQEEIMNALNQNTEDIKLIREELSKVNEKIGRDYIRINELQDMTRKQQAYIDDSMEESELIVRSLLGVVQGLQELGANGPTKQTESDIKDYLVKKSHRTNKFDGLHG